VAVRVILPTWFDHLEKSFSDKEVQFRKFYSSVKTSCPPAENVNDTPDMYITYLSDDHYDDDDDYCYYYY